MTPVRLLAIIEAYDITGPAKNLLEFARLAREEGSVDTTVATFVRGHTTNLFLETARGRGVPVHAIRERGPFDTSVLEHLRSITAEVRPHVIQTHAVKSHFLARLADLPHRAPWIAFHHGYTWPTWRARLYNQLDRWSLPAAVKVITVSSPFREELISRGVPAEKIDIVHNAIQPGWGCRRDAAVALRDSLQIPPDHRVLLIVGRLSREKDHATLLNAIASLVSVWKIHLVIVGEGPERPRIESEIRRLGLSGCVTLTGQQPSAEPYYGMADVAVLSSLSEGSPNALLEALAAGVPVVATSVGGIPEIAVHDETALLVPAADARRMAAAIQKVLEDSALTTRLTARGRQLIAGAFAPETRASRLAGIYRSVAGT